MYLNIWGSNDYQDEQLPPQAQPAQGQGQPNKQALYQFLQNSAGQPNKQMKQSAPAPKK